MIVCKIQGGLGNQLFQWAFGRNLSLKFDRNLFLDSNFYFNQGSVVRQFSLNLYNIEINNLDNDAINIMRRSPIKLITDNSTFFELDILNEENYYLDGYWQSEKFFSENEKVILKELRYDSPRMRSIHKGMNFENEQTVSLHFRRGDYVGADDFYTTLNNGYYHDALDIIGDYDRVLIFSDDIAWCKENLKFRNMIFSEGLSNVEDLALMSKCHHNIIANSSFSWWAAKLNENSNKKIVAPVKWFGPKLDLDTKDLIPTSWIKI